MEPVPSPDTESAAPQTAYTPQPAGDAIAQPDGPASPVTARVPTPTARSERRRRVRQFFVVAFAVIALLCLGGVGTAVLLYDRATKPNLSTPALVTREYLSDFLVNRDDVRAGQFECSDKSGLAAVQALRADDDDRERKYNLKIAVSVESVVEVSRSAASAIVDADVIVSTVDAGRHLRRVQHWEFTTRNDGGWRVCGGHEVT